MPGSRCLPKRCRAARRHPPQRFHFGVVMITKESNWLTCKMIYYISVYQNDVHVHVLLLRHYRIGFVSFLADRDPRPVQITMNE